MCPCVISLNSSLCLLACPFPEDSLSSETSVPSPGGTLTLTIKRLLFCAVQTNQSDLVANFGPFIAFLSYVRTVVKGSKEVGALGPPHTHTGYLRS